MAYRNTLQADALTLVAQKLQSSLAVEGKLPEDGLAGFGDAGDDLMMVLARKLVSGDADDASVEDIFRQEQEIAAEAGQPLVDQDCQRTEPQPALLVALPSGAEPAAAMYAVFRRVREHCAPRQSRIDKSPWAVSRVILTLWIRIAASTGRQRTRIGRPPPSSRSTLCYAAIGSLNLPVADRLGIRQRPSPTVEREQGHAQPSRAEDARRSAPPLSNVPEFAIPCVEADALERVEMSRDGAAADQRDPDTAFHERVVGPPDERLSLGPS